VRRDRSARVRTASRLGENRTGQDDGRGVLPGHQAAGRRRTLSVDQESGTRRADDAALFDRRTGRTGDRALLQVHEPRRAYGDVPRRLCVVFYLFSDCKVKEPSAAAKDPELATRLWEKSVEMTGLKDYDMFNSTDDALPEPLKDV